MVSFRCVRSLPSKLATINGSFLTRRLNVASRPSDLIGQTPLLDLGKILEARGITHGVKLYGKMESLGPCSSVKDRLGRSMIDDAEARGLITPGRTVLVEPTSGNTGIALAFIARERGYRCILTMPETMSVERRMMLLALGCEVVLTPKETAVPGALAKAQEIVEGLNGDGYMLQQLRILPIPKYIGKRRDRKFGAIPMGGLTCLYLVSVQEELCREFLNSSRGRLNMDVRRSNLTSTQWPLNPWSK